MKTLILPIALLLSVQLAAQDGEIFAIRDSICIMAGEPLNYNVKANDENLIGMDLPVFLLTNSECFDLDLEGNLSFRPGAGDCCGEHHLAYRYEGCQQPSVCDAEIIIIVKCPKPDCSNVDLSDFLPAGEDPTGGNPGSTPCVASCEGAQATYYLPYFPSNTYTWTVSGGTFTIGSDPAEIIVNWGSPGPGNISVSITNASSETVTTNICVDILAAPVASFTKSADTICLNSTVYFTNTSINANSWFWDFGDGTGSSLYDPSHQYTSPGTYPVTLVVTQNNQTPNGDPSCCCTDTMMMDIVVEPLAGPPIYWISTLCAGDSSKYWTDASNCSSYQWTVLDENDAPLTFTGQGTDTICVTWGNGPFGQISLEVDNCDSAYCDQPSLAIVPIIAPTVPIAGLTDVCENEVATYTVPKWVSVDYNWQVSGGTILSGQGTHSVTIQWGTAPGPGQIMLGYSSEFLGGLPGQDPENCEGSATLSVAIAPTFSVDGPVKVCVESSSSFFATATPSASYTWSISPGVTFTGQGTASINVSWDAGPGTFVVTATPDDPSAYCNDAVTLYVEVIEIPKPAGIDGPVEICPGGTDTYLAQTTESGVGFFWIISGGAPVSAIGNPLVVNWSNTGPYSIALRQFDLNDPFCLSDTILLNLSPKELTGPLVISGPDGCTNMTQSYSVGPGQHPETDFQWSISPATAGSVVGGQGTPTVMVQWNDNPGSPTLQVVASLCDDMLTGTLAVNLTAAPPPTIVQTGVLCPGVPATLDAGAGYTAYNWSNGATTQTTTISTGGSYVVTVTDANGCTAVATYQAVALDGPVASISSPDPLFLCSNPPNNTGTVTINALTGTGYTYAWYCNGVLQALPSSQDFLVHANTQTPASFSYWVEVTDGDGCTNQSNTITVVQNVCDGGPGGCQPRPYALSFTSTPNLPYCNEIDFFASSSFTATPTGWNFGDPDNNINTGSILNATHTYSTAGCYLVTLSADVLSFGPGPPCMVTTTGSVCIPLAADFSASVNCFDVSFCDQSTYLSGQGPTSYMWQFGDGNTSTAIKPTHTYGAAGTYTVTLEVMNDDGCVAIYSEDITVTSSPPPSITTSPGPICVDAAVQFMGSGSSIISWLWDFDDGAMNGDQNPSHSYGAPGTYTVQLSVVNDQGCADTVFTTLEVFPNPPADTIAWTPSLTICDGSTTSLTAPSGAGYTYLWTTGATTASITVGTAGSYGVTVTDANGCELVPDPVMVIVLPLPPAEISGPEVICDEGCIDLMAPLGTSYSYQWFENGTVPIPGAISSTLTVCDVTLNSPYSVQVTDANGCSNTSALHPVSLATSPVFSVQVMPDSCEGTLSTLSVVPIQPDVIYQWNTGAMGPSISTAQAGLYTAVGTDTLTGCRHSASATIYPLPDLCLVPVGCYESCNPDTLCGPPGLAAYQWNLDGIPIAGETNPCLIATMSGTYSLTGTTAFGCTETSDSLLLELIDCGCEGLEVMADPSPTDSCCWTLSYDHQLNTDLYGLKIYTNDANLDVDFSSIHASLMPSSSTPNSINLIGATGPTLPTGMVTDFIDFCFSDITNSPQQLIFDWYDEDYNVACSDTLLFDCIVEPDCLYLLADSIYCEDGLVMYEMTVCNPVDAPYPIAYIDIQTFSPPSVAVTPPALDLTSNPLVAGACRTFKVQIGGSFLAGDDFCYNLIAHDQVPLVDTALCCSLDTLYCIPIPDCDPCDDVEVTYVEEVFSGDGFCCYDIGLTNAYQSGFFDGIGLCMLTDGTSMSMNNPFGSGWNTTLYSARNIQLQAAPPLGTSLPLGAINLPEICVDTEQGPDQLLEIKWLIGDSIVCRDTVRLSCEPPCGYIQEEEILCNSTLTGWNYNGVLKNTSAYTMGEAQIVFTSPIGLSAYDVTLPLGSLPPGGFYPFTIPLGAPAQPGDTVCFTVALHELGDDEQHTNCCNFSDCIVLPDCPVALECLCDENYVDQVNLGINCLSPPTSAMQTFSPLGQFQDCDAVTWTILGTENASGNSTGNDEISFSLTVPGDYTVCIKVNRTDDNGQLCSESTCKDFVLTDTSPFVGPMVYPNPADDVVWVRWGPQQAPTAPIQVTDMLGQRMASYPVALNGTHKTRIDISQLPAGVYWLEVELAGKHHAVKLVIL